MSFSCNGQESRSRWTAGIVASIWRAKYVRRVQRLTIVTAIFCWAINAWETYIIIGENRNRGSSSWICGLPCTILTKVSPPLFPWARCYWSKGFQRSPGLQRHGSHSFVYKHFAATSTHASMHMQIHIYILQTYIDSRSPLLPRGWKVVEVRVRS